MFSIYRVILVTMVAILAVASFIIPAEASTINGTIDSTNKYVWASVAGWLNFGATNGNVTITDSALTGYAWSDNYGWINLAPTNSGVVNDAEGNLSGYAWSEKLGWIDFSNVVINSDGLFTGTAIGDNIGTINFDCTNCSVQTDWRPQSTRSTSSTSNNVTTGGGYSGNVYVSPQNYAVEINGGATSTMASKVSLKLISDQNTNYVWLSDDDKFISAYQTMFNPVNNDNYILVNYTLPENSGNKTVYAKFCNQWGYCGAIVSDSIILIDNLTQPNTSTTQVVVDEVPDEDSSLVIISPVVDQEKSDISFINQTGQIIKDAIIVVPEKFSQLISRLGSIVSDSLASIFKPQSTPIVDNSQYVSQSTPLAMQGNWNLLPREAINNYVFAPVPSEFKALAGKFPDLDNLFKELKIENLNDLSKLANARINLPGMTKASGLNFSALNTGKPIEDLSSEFKDSLPTNIVFTRGVNQLVDFGSVLSLTVDGNPLQKVKTISGKKISLSIKPEFAAKSVKGYISFKSRDKTLSGQGRGKLQSLASYLNPISPAYAASQTILSQPELMEQKLVLQVFDYQDLDNDGIYTAEVYSPVSAGEYEILTIIEYVDPDKGSKAVRLVTVVDPEGYVYEKIKDKELRIPNAMVRLYWLNPETKAYELWPADKYQQQNGQLTDNRGSYAFLVPAGSYYLTVYSPGYEEYQSAPFRVLEGDGVHINIELKSKSWWSISWDWKTWVIILMALEILYLLEKELKRKIKIKHKK